MSDRYDISQSLANIKAVVEKYEEERNEAIEKMKNWNKDEEIQRLQKIINSLEENLSRGFCPDEQEWENIKKWQESHKKRMHPVSERYETAFKSNPFAPSYHYDFVYSEVGRLGSVVCRTCQRKAIVESEGDIAQLKKLIKDYDAEYYFGEV